MRKPKQKKVVDSRHNLGYTILKMDGYTTAQVARIIGVSKNTILRWLHQGVLQEPKRAAVASSEWRIWTNEDVERARQVKSGMRPGPKRKNREKIGGQK